MPDRISPDPKDCGASLRGGAFPIEEPLYKGSAVASARPIPSPLSLSHRSGAFEPWVVDFVRESNAISGLHREPTPAEVGAHRGLLAADAIEVGNLEMFARHVEAAAVLRSGPGLAGDATKDETDDTVASDLETIIYAARGGLATPVELHRLYRALRPFTDAN